MLEARGFAPPPHDGFAFLVDVRVIPVLAICHPYSLSVKPYGPGYLVHGRLVRQTGRYFPKTSRRVSETSPTVARLESASFIG